MNRALFYKEFRAAANEVTDSMREYSRYEIVPLSKNYYASKRPNGLWFQYLPRFRALPGNL
jgi:hypothetical protein